MKKTVCILLVAVFLLSLAGCAQSNDDSAFTAANEIFTYQKLDKEKTQLVVSRTGNIPVEQLCSAFEELNPDVQVIFLDITGGDSGYAPLNDWIIHGDLPDVMISAANFCRDELLADHFVKLSDDPIIQNFEAAALQRTAVSSQIYMLPGPSDISSMMYNKTLFDQYGWEFPATFDEFVALCDRIREDTNGEVEPWNPNAKYSQELLIALEAMSYEEVFGGIENRGWYDRLLAGEATFSDNMTPFVEMIETLVEHDILREEHFTYSATTRGNEFADGKIAMINMNIFDADNDRFDFALAPYPGTKGELGYLCSSYSCFLGVPVKEHTARENDAIDRFLAFFSSPEGQNAYIGNTMKISNIKGASTDASPKLDALREAVDAGHQFTLLDFTPTVSGRYYQLHNYVLAMAKGELTAESCLEVLDAQVSAPVEVKAETPPETVATVAEDLSILETSFLIADGYRNITDADIGLIAHNEAYRGNLMRLYAGDITPGVVHVLKPRSFGNGSTLIKASMTGKQLLDAVNEPVGNGKIADCVYAFSGLQCRVAPWNDLGSRYLSVKLEDGSELEADKLYTVAFWDGTVGDEHISEILEAYEGSWDELMTAYLKEVGTITPTADGRIELVWE